MKIGIVTDNTANLSQEYYEKNDIGVVSLYIRRNGGFVKAINIDPLAYYREIRDSKINPQTSQPSPADFREVYESMLKKYDFLISVHISGKLSGTVDSARLAAMEFGGKVEVVDSQTTSSGLGFLVMKLVELRNEGFSHKALINYAREFHNSVRIIFNVRDLMYLHKGGRIGKAKALLGKILRIHPILELKNGEVVPADTARLRKRMFKKMLRLGRIEGRDFKKAVVLHTDNLKEAMILKDLVEEEYGNDSRVSVGVCDVVIGTHLGPGGVGIISLWE